MAILIPASLPADLYLPEALQTLYAADDCPASTRQIRIAPRVPAWSQRHSFIFAAVNPCPQRPPCFSGKLPKGQSAISSGFSFLNNCSRIAGVNPLRVRDA